VQKVIQGRSPTGTGSYRIPGIKGVFVMSLTENSLSGRITTLIRLVSIVGVSLEKQTKWRDQGWNIF